MIFMHSALPPTSIILPHFKTTKEITIVVKITGIAGQYFHIMTWQRNSNRIAIISLQLTTIISIFCSNANFGYAFNHYFSTSIVRIKSCGSSGHLQFPSSCAGNSLKGAGDEHRRVGGTMKAAHPDGRAYDYDDDSSRSQYYYKPEPNAGPISESCKFTEKQINFFLNKRRECKRTKQFDKADQILIGLNQNGVYVHDKRREWRADGENYFGRSVYNIHTNYVLRGGTYGLLTEKDIQDISKLLEARSYAKRNKEYPRSDGITDILKTKYSVKVDDKNREWSVQHNPTNTDSDNVANDYIYVPSPLAPLDHPTHTMSDELKTQIAQQLSDRVSLRMQKDYHSADKIRDELMEKFSIAIDDRTKEWKVVELSDDENFEYVYDPFVNGANLSQRSAFVREGNDKNNSHNNVEISNNEPVSEQQDHELALPSSSFDDLDISLSKIFSDEEIIDEDGENNNVVESEEEELQQKKIKLLNSLTVVKLKEQLREAGLPVSGKKKDLVERLLINT